MGNTDEDPFIELEKSYCPPVDSALFAALASDYDLSTPDNIENLREALEAIKGLAVEQEDLPFDPSGTANNHVNGLGLGGFTSDNGTSNPGHGTCHTQTDLTSLSSPMISNDGDDTAPRAQSKTRATYTIAADGSLELTGATHEDKVHSLADMFPSISILGIEHALKKSNGDISKSMDGLLNLAFFGETQTAQDDTRVFIPKGIDGFVSGSPDTSHQRSRKKKRSKNRNPSLDVASLSEKAPMPNKWETGNADIEFICSRTPDFPPGKVKSTYYANSMSLPATIRAMALAAAPKEAKEIEDDPVMLAQVAELANDYHSIPTTTLVGLLRVTSNMISATNELAAVMMRQPQISVDELIKFTPTPLNLNDEEDAFYPRSRGNESSQGVLSYEQAQVLSEAHFAAGSAAYSQASQAARRARSNHLYGGAAAVYRERGQEHRALAMQQLAAASDRLVDRQSVNCDLDLHGVTVANALRISRDRVDAWWDSLGDAKHVRGGGKHVHGGFKIVTGVGLHSHDGTSRLGPAVSKMLMQDGWRVEVERGFILVTGKGRQ